MVICGPQHHRENWLATQLTLYIRLLLMAARHKLQIANNTIYNKTAITYTRLPAMHRVHHNTLIL